MVLAITSRMRSEGLQEVVSLQNRGKLLRKLEKRM